MQIVTLPAENCLVQILMSDVLLEGKTMMTRRRATVVIIVAVCIEGVHNPLHNSSSFSWPAALKLILFHLIPLQQDIAIFQVVSSG